MTEIDEIILENCSLEEETTQEDTSKREFFISMIKQGKAESSLARRRGR